VRRVIYQEDSRSPSDGVQTNFRAHPLMPVGLGGVSSLEGGTIPDIASAQRRSSQSSATEFETPVRRPSLTGAAIAAICDG
jgi:hypothetical protein